MLHVCVWTIHHPHVWHTNRQDSSWHVPSVHNFENTRRWERRRVSNLQSCWNGIGHKSGNLLFTFHQSICHSDTPATTVCKQMLVNKSQRHFSTFAGTEIFFIAWSIDVRYLRDWQTCHDKQLHNTMHCCTWEIIDEGLLNYWKLMHSHICAALTHSFSIIQQSRPRETREIWWSSQLWLTWDFPIPLCSYFNTIDV